MVTGSRCRSSPVHCQKGFCPSIPFANSPFVSPLLHQVRFAPQPSSSGFEEHLEVGLPLFVLSTMALALEHGQAVWVWKALGVLFCFVKMTRASIPALLEGLFWK